MWDFQARLKDNEKSAEFEIGTRKSDLFCLQMAMCGELVENPRETWRILSRICDVMPSGVSLGARRRSQESCLPLPILAGRLVSITDTRPVLFHICNCSFCWTCKVYSIRIPATCHLFAFTSFYSNVIVSVVKHCAISHKLSFGSVSFLFGNI